MCAYVTWNVHVYVFQAWHVCKFKQIIARILFLIVLEPRKPRKVELALLVPNRDFHLMNTNSGCIHSYRVDGILFEVFLIRSDITHTQLTFRSFLLTASVFTNLKWICENTSRPWLHLTPGSQVHHTRLCNVQPLLLWSHLLSVTTPIWPVHSTHVGGFLFRVFTLSFCLSVGKW